MEISLTRNKNWREKYTDARWWRWCIDDRRRGIIVSFPVAIVAIRPMHRLVVAISMPSFLVTAIVMSFHSSMVITTLAEGRSHAYTADHGD
jgi:hypothetical protein